MLQTGRRSSRSSGTYRFASQHPYFRETRPSSFRPSSLGWRWCKCRTCVKPWFNVVFHFDLKLNCKQLSKNIDHLHWLKAANLFYCLFIYYFIYLFQHYVFITVQLLAVPLIQGTLYLRTHRLYRSLVPLRQ